MVSRIRYGDQDVAKQEYRPGATDVTHQYNQLRKIWAANIGSALALYDLSIYGYFAIVIGKLFFPFDNSATSLLLSVASFSLFFVARPLGAIVLGSYSDKAGPKASLTVSISLTMLGTAITAFLPTHAQIGIAAPIILVAARMLQGFASGGEFGAATALVVDTAGSRRRGFFASWQMSTQGLATVLAAGMSALLSWALTDTQLNEWGWRLAFAVGLLIGPVGLYLRRNIDETNVIKELCATSKSKKNSPLREAFVFHWRNILLGGGVIAAPTALNFLHKQYMPTYAVKQLHLPATTSFLGAAVTGILLMIAAPVVGALSDSHGRFKVMAIALGVAAVTTYPLFLLLTISPSAGTLMLVQIFAGLLLAACVGALPALLVDIFPENIRGTGLALSFNFSVTLFGGFAP